MNTYDPDLHEQHRKLDAIDARLARHQQTTRTALILFSLLVALALMLIVNHIPQCATMLETLLRSLP
ncbi:hypothetical protein [Microvirga subterranea]|uniref:Uncharacterized protein n=1 Tax=Microvirga subterranea TaxID=186651 RepID=A0A370H0P6_9HYPH|nr:hypothetical protein [Microvirga subterranea]RDI49563.1 hypothetical protein DES45_1274 [Microvirga subterranea]